MFPEYSHGDFVVATKFPFVIKKLTVGDDIIFFHKDYEYLIKRISSVFPDGRFFVKGINQHSIDSNKLGLIDFNSIKGKIIYHIIKSI